MATLKLSFSNYLMSIQKDFRVKASHITIYAAILQLWNESSETNSIQISRRKIMSLSKIKSLTTYHALMKDLIKFGYIGYEPSYHPKEGSKVELKDPHSIQILDRKLIDGK